MSNKTEVRIVSSITDLVTLEKMYQSLFNDCVDAHIDNSFALVLANAKVLRRNKLWRAFFLIKNEKVQACIFGYQTIRKRFGISIPVFVIGSEFVSDPLIGPDVDSETLQLLIEAMIVDRAQCAFFDFGRLADSRFNALIKCIEKKKHKYKWTWSGYGFYIDTHLGKDFFLSKLNKKTIQSLNRDHRRLLDKHSIDLRIEQSIDNGLNSERFEEFVAMETSGWKGKAKTSIRIKPDNEDYFREIVNEATKVGQMVWCTLRAENKPIAMMFCLYSHGTLWVPKVAYDEDFSQYGPGKLAHHLVFLRIIEEQSFTRINFISGAPWMSLWRPSRLEYRSILLYGNSLKAKFLFFSIKVLDIFRKFFLNHDVQSVNRDKPYL